MSTNQNIMKCIGFYFCIHWYNDSLRVVAGARGWGPAGAGVQLGLGLGGRRGLMGAVAGSMGWEQGLHTGSEAAWLGLRLESG